MPTLPQRLREMARTTGLDGVAELLVEAAEAMERPEQPDWSDSKTGPCELWKNRLRPLVENLEVADGAISFRDEVIANLRAQLAAAKAAVEAMEQRGEPEYWQWRRKDKPWTLDKTFNCQVFATTDDSEVRALYAAPQPPASQSIEPIPYEPTTEMIEAGAQALVQWETGAVWPDSWGSDAARHRRDARKVWMAMYGSANGIKD